MTQPPGRYPGAPSATPSDRVEARSRRALVLGGGNALGAYHLGACEALHSAHWEPDLVVGASIGAVTGAILLGNPVDTWSACPARPRPASR